MSSKNTKSAQTTKAAIPAAPRPVIRFGRTLGKPIHRFRVIVSVDGGKNFTDALIMSRNDADAAPCYTVEWADGDLDEIVNESYDPMSLKNHRSAKHTKNALRPIVRRAMVADSDGNVPWTPTEDVSAPETLEAEMAKRPPSARWEPEAYARWVAVQEAAAAEAEATEGDEPEAGENS